MLNDLRPLPPEDAEQFYTPTVLDAYPKEFGGLRKRQDHLIEIGPMQAGAGCRLRTSSGEQDRMIQLAGSILH